MRKIALNARFYSHRPTGMQRYGVEMASRMANDLDVLRPRRPLRGAEGHMWEQAYLAGAARGRLLWSPNNTGPLAVARQICTVHDIIPLERPEWFTPGFVRLYRWLMPRLARRVQHIIAISEFTKQRLIERLGVAPERITVIYNGVDACFSPRPADEIERVRTELRIPTPHYVLCLGSVEPRKNQARLLAAWERVARRFPSDVHLVVAGARGSSTVFTEVTLDRIPDRVHFTGYVKQEHLPALYSGALALCYPSLYEGFGLPPVEAMACGTPVVTSASTSLPEVVGSAAVLVNAEEIDDIGEGMRRVVESADLRASLRKTGLAKAATYSWDAAAALTRGLLHQFA
ncbi:MAG TPA: glycosyltransferase family 1 protein [Bryobacteraceae bacterium]|nr:glycosyltransferase family 1 protein [Bryobacteraceae bacterium]